MVLENGAFTDPVRGLSRNGSFPLLVALDEFMQIKQKTLTKQSYSTYEKWYRYFQEFLEYHGYLEISLERFSHEQADELRRYALGVQLMGNKSFNTYKGFLSGFFIHCQKPFKLVGNPIAETVESLPLKRSVKHHYYNKAQIQQYKQLCETLDHPQLWFFCQFIYYTFCRPNEEARKLQVGHIRSDHIILYGETSKTGHRTVMIPAALEIVLQELRIRDFPPHYYVFSHDGQPGPSLLGRTWMYDRHTKIMKEMELTGQGYDIYGWKHTGAIALYLATKDLMLVKEQCGHSDISQTVQYLRDLGVFHYSKAIHKFPAI